MTNKAPGPQEGLEGLPVLVAVRTALAGAHEGIFRHLPEDLRGCTVKQALDYVLGGDLSADEQPWARTVGEVMGKEQYSMGVNEAANVDQATPLSGYLVLQQHPHPRDEPGASEHLRYAFADIRVTAPQRGGIEYIARR